jgi:hypothetical protein
MSNQIAVPYAIAPKQEQTLLFKLIFDGAWLFRICDLILQPLP